MSVPTFDDKPLTDNQMKLILQDIGSELAEVKNIAIDTNAQAKKTNGRVNWMEKTIWTALGAVPLLTIWAGWLTIHALQPIQTATPDQIQAAVAEGIHEALSNNK